MVNQMLTLQEAAFLSRKSSQTIRRLIKSNKIKYRRRRTPQGFNYFIEKESLLDFFDLTPRVLPDEPMEEEAYMEEPQNSVTSQNQQKSVFNAKISPSKPNEEGTIISRPINADQNHHQAIISQSMQNTISLQTKQLQKFAETINQLINQHHQERSNLFGLIQNYENKIKSLESQIKVISAPKKKWYEFWK